MAGGEVGGQEPAGQAQGRRAQRRGTADLSREGEGRRSEKKGDGGQGGGSSPAQSAWPSKPRMDVEKLEEFCEAVRKSCGESCRFFLIGR